MAACLRVYVQGADEWVEAGTLAPSDPPASISTNPPGGDRDVIMFRCCGGYSLIERSTGGVDALDDGGATRVILGTGGTETLARLEPGQSHEMTITTDAGLTYPVRWTHLDHDPV